ncbi:MAG: hypothetical protein WBM56_12815 [Robiginitalea sp.]|uniref:hypothetical protein n=1 Tax=Robiginitalea sp. TaxID=1902411 RepID=UPI003C70853D
MRNHLLRVGAFLVLLISVSCEKQENPENAPANYFITKDLSFLLDDLHDEAAKGWPANGCQSFDVTVSILGAKIKTTIQHCCVRYACTITPVANILDSFVGDKSGKTPREIEVISSEMIKFKGYDIKIHPGKYPLDGKTRGLKGIEYEVWVNTP